MKRYRTWEEAWARLAELEAMVDTEPGIRVQHPGRGRAVLACACGQVLDARDMVRIRTPRAGFNHDTSTAIYRIGCEACAALAAGIAARRPRWVRRSWRG